MNYKEYIEQAYETACNSGFHDVKKPLEHWLMLVITEVAEAVEADRRQKHANVAMFERESVTQQPAGREDAHWKFCFERFVKDTVEDELADVCIRLFDIAGEYKLDIKERDINNGLRQDFVNNYVGFPTTKKAMWICRKMTVERLSADALELALFYVACWAKAEKINLQWHIEKKMRYNAMRSRMHGKQY